MIFNVHLVFVWPVDLSVFDVMEFIGSLLTARTRILSSTRVREPIRNAIFTTIYRISTLGFLHVRTRGSVGIIQISTICSSGTRDSWEARLGGCNALLVCY